MEEYIRIRKIQQIANESGTLEHFLKQSELKKCVSIDSDCFEMAIELSQLSRKKGMTVSTLIY